MSMSAFHRFASLLLAVFVLVALGAVPASGSDSVSETDVLHYIEHTADEPGLDGAHSVAVSIWDALATLACYDIHNVR